MISKNQIKLIKQLEQKKFRRREGLFVAEGPKVVGDLMGRSRPAAVYATEDYAPPHPVAIQRITDDELRRISFLQHPQQVLALFPLPAAAAPPSPASAPASPATSAPTSPTSAPTSPTSAPTSPTSAPSGFAAGSLTLALDGIQDPGNLGTIIRLADWFGISTIICSEDTADAWNPKVVQATMGSIARVDIVYTNLPEMLDRLPADVPVYGTLLDGDNIYRQELSQQGIIIMGNEGNGLSPEVRRRVNRRLLIPTFNVGDTAESLNVAIATAIICSEFRRRSQ